MTRRNPSRARRTQRRAQERAELERRRGETAEMHVPEHIRKLGLPQPAKSIQIEEEEAP